MHNNDQHLYLSAPKLKKQATYSDLPYSLIDFYSNRFSRDLAKELY